jgi:cell division protein ZapE
MSASISVQCGARRRRQMNATAPRSRRADLARESVPSALARKSSSLGWLFGTRARETEHIKGLHVFGEVSRGRPC